MGMVGGKRNYRKENRPKKRPRKKKYVGVCECERGFANDQSGEAISRKMKSIAIGHEAHKSLVERLEF